MGSAVLVAAALLAGAGRALEANDAVVPPLGGVDDVSPAAMRAFPADTDKVGADTVLHAPPGPLASRWQWARDEETPRLPRLWEATRSSRWRRRRTARSTSAAWSGVDWRARASACAAGS